MLVLIPKQVAWMKVQAMGEGDKRHDWELLQFALVPLLNRPDHGGMDADTVREGSYRQPGSDAARLYEGGVQPDIHWRAARG